VLQRKDYYSVLYEYYVGQLGHIVLFYFFAVVVEQSFWLYATYSSYDLTDLNHVHVLTQN